MPTLLLSPRGNDDTGALRAAADAAPDWQAITAPAWRLPEDFAVPPPVAVYGDPLFADLAAMTLRLALLEPPLDFLTRLLHSFVRRSVRVGTLAEARTLSVPQFVKPAEDKSFEARVYETGAELPGVEAGLPEDMPVLIAEPVRWTTEYRCFVRDSAVAAMSPYFRRGRLARDKKTGAWVSPPGERDAAEAFAGSVLAVAGGYLPAGVVLDVGRIAGQGWAVVEANPAWASGIYGCAPAAVLPVVARSVVSREAVPAMDIAFVRSAIAVE